MSTHSTDLSEQGMTPTFAKPPVVEFSLGAQFDVLSKLSAGHFGQLWNEFGADWTKPGDGPSIQDQFETFGQPATGVPPQLQFRFGPAPTVGRFTLSNDVQDRLLQIQPTRFLLNWKRTESMKPSYKNLINQFTAMFERLQQFIDTNNLGPLVVNQWEVTYVDSFAKGEYWETSKDWSKILPGLFGELFDSDDLELNLERRAAQWSFEISPQRGRLHIVGQPGRWPGDSRECLLLTTTARGPVGTNGVATLREGLDLGHDKAVTAFLEIVNSELHPQWGPMT